MDLDWSKKNLLELVRKAYRGEVMLPNFQRSFVWKRGNIEELICSLLENMFIGTFLIQQVNPETLPFKTIPIEGADKVNPLFSQKPEILVLDGQQRITSLFYALYSPPLPLKNTTNPYAFFIDLHQLGDDNIEEAVFSWSKEGRDYKSLVAEGEYQLEKLKKRGILPLTFLAEESNFWKLWYGQYRTLFEEEKAQKIEEYLKNLIQYQIHILTLPITAKPENIATLFERINRTGVKLSIFDLLTARLYKFINLRSEWEKAFQQNYRLRLLASNNLKNTKIPYYIIQGLALSENLSIKASEIIKIDEQVLNKQNWEKALKILEEKVLPKLFDISEYGIASPEWLPYTVVISIWLGLFLKGERGEIQVDSDKLNKWYWCVIFSERYSGTTESKQMKDFKELIEWFKDSNRTPEVVDFLRTSLGSLKIGAKHSRGSIYKGVFNLLFRKGASDFYIKEKIKYSPEQLEDHHIFPKNFLEKKGVEVEKDGILNRTLILAETNRKISRKAPTTYIKEMIKIHGSEEKVKDILKCHFIDEEMFQILKSVTEESSPLEIKEKFNLFIRKREQLLKEEIKYLIN